MQKKDTDKLDHILGSDWAMVTPTGKIVSKSEALADLKSGAAHYQSVTLGDMNVRVFGHTAVVRGSSEENSQYNGRDTSGHYVFNDVFVKRDGYWKAVSTQLTRVTTE